MQEWSDVEARVGGLIWVPFAFQLVRGLVPALLAGIARDHPRRELLAVLCLLVGFVSDLLDGHLARYLRMTGLLWLEVGDRIADFTFWIGAAALLGLRWSLATDLGPERLAALRAPERRRRGRLIEAGLIALAVLLFVELNLLIVERTLR